MKKTLIYALAASVAVLASCAKEATVKEAPAKETVPCTISFGADTTKSYINYQGHTFWTPDDLISVFSDQGTRKVFIATTGEGATNSDFTCEDWIAGETPEWAVFCYEEKATPSKTYDVALTADGVFSANVSEYQPVSVSHSFGSFGSKANISVAEITNNQGTYSGQMKNALGLVKITIPKGADNVAEIILEDAAGTAPIAGKVTINCTGDNPVCTPIDGQGKSRISAKWAKTGSFTAEKPIFFCVIPGVSFTPKFTFVKTDGSKASVTGNKTISVSRNKYFDCGTPSSLDFIPEGYVKDTVAIDLGNKKQPFNQAYVTVSKQKDPANPKDAEYTYTNVAGNTYKYVLCGTGTNGTYSYSAANKELQFSSSNEGNEYIEIVAPENGYILSLSFDTNNRADKKIYSINATTGSESIPATAPTKVSTVSVDLSSTTYAKNGCRIVMPTAASIYSYRALRVAYAISEAE